MEDILYFDIIPIELTFLVVSNLDETSVNSFSLVDYKYRFLLVKDETWKTLFTNRFPLEYQFIINIKNIDGCSSWKDIFKTYDKGKKISDLSTQGTYSYLDNVYYFNLIYKEYPKIWLEIQDINLDHIGISGINRKDLNWYWIYRTLKDLTGNSNFVKNNYKNYDDFGIVLGLIYRRLGQSFMDAMIIYIYIYEKNSEKVISMDKLRS